MININHQNRIHTIYKFATHKQWLFIQQWKHETMFLSFSFLWFINKIRSRHQIKSDQREIESKETQIRLERKNQDTQGKSERELNRVVYQIQKTVKPTKTNNQTQQPNYGLKLQWGFDVKSENAERRRLAKSNQAKGKTTTAKQQQLTVTSEEWKAIDLGGRPWTKLAKELLRSGLERKSERL